jgi:phage terminase large subunit-like protein
MYELEGVIMDGRLHHDGNPILAWMISNIVCLPRQQEQHLPTQGARRKQDRRRDIAAHDGCSAEQPLRNQH